MVSQRMSNWAQVNERSSSHRVGAAASFAAQLVATCLLVALAASSMELFNVKFVESNGSRLIATSNLNYAISSPKLAEKSWRTVSVNGDQVMAISVTGERVLLARAALAPTDLALIERLRDEIATSNDGYTHTSTASGNNNLGSSFTMAGVSSSSFSSSGAGTNFESRGGDMSFHLRDPNNFSVARSDMPFGWSRVFFNDDLVTLVHRNGEVLMQPLGALEPAKLEAINRLKADISEMQRAQVSTVQNSMNMVSSVFNNIMGRFPRPPSYQSAVGGMFGNNFPFGPNNSPFDSAAGWPFGGAAAGAGAGAGAFAFAHRR